MKLATLGLMADSGCHIALLDLHSDLIPLLKNFQLVHSYILTDSKKIPDYVDVMVVEGGVRTTHDEEILRVAREKSKRLVALGSCACFGGIPALCNVHELEETFKYVYSETASTVGGTLPAEVVPRVKNTVQPISQYVKVNIKIPGCPPLVGDIKSAFEAILEDKVWTLPKMTVCDECDRERSSCRAFNFWNTLVKQPVTVHRNFEEPDLEQCLADQEYICMGPATQGGCKALCPTVGIPCDGCRGPMTEGSPMREAIYSAALRNARDSGVLLQHINAFYRFTLGLLDIAKE